MTIRKFNNTSSLFLWPLDHRQLRPRWYLWISPPVWVDTWNTSLLGHIPRPQWISCSLPLVEGHWVKKITKHYTCIAMIGNDAEALLGLAVTSLHRRFRQGGKENEKIGWLVIQWTSTLWWTNMAIKIPHFQQEIHLQKVHFLLPC